MKNKPAPHTDIKLKRALGVFAVFAAALGGAASQTSIVGLLNAAGIGGGTFLLAFLIALLLAISYVMSFSELSVMMPKAGGMSTYTAVSFGHFPAIIVTLVGTIGPAIFAAPAEFLLLDKLMHVMYPGIMAHPSLILWTLFTILNILGVNIFSGAQKILSYVMLIALVVIGFYGFGFDSAKGVPMQEIWHGFKLVNAGLFSLIMLAVWPLVGLESTCTLAEETKNPGKNMPGGLFLALGALFVAYFIYAFGAIKVMPAKDLATSEIPHWLFAQAMFGKAGRIIILILGIATTSVGMNGTIAAQGRLLFGMSHHHQLPPVFKSVHPKWRTPWVSLITIYVLSSASLLLFGNMPGFILIMIISASSAFLMVYIIAHINVIVLRFKYPHFKRPFKTPWYPLPQVIGIAGMVYALIYNSPSAALANKVYINSAVLVGAAVIYAFFRVKYVMKNRLFKPEPIEQAISD